MDWIWKAAKCGSQQLARNQNWCKYSQLIDANKNFLGLSYRKVFKMNFILKTLKLLSIEAQSLFSLFLSPSVSGRNQSVERGGWWHCFPKPTQWPFGKRENICVLPVKFYKKYCSICFNSYKKLLQLISVHMFGPWMWISIYLFLSSSIYGDFFWQLKIPWVHNLKGFIQHVLLFVKEKGWCFLWGKK